MSDRLSPRNIIFLILAAAAAALFTRLGIWQLDRRSERLARNALVIERLAAPPVSLDALPRDTGLAHFRRVAIDGHYDYAHEIAWANRSREGSPGVNLVTPLRRSGTDTAVLVDRGWVYAPDGENIDRPHWREPDSASAIGRVQELNQPLDQSATRLGHPDEVRWISRDSLSRWAGYPIAPYIVVLEGDTSTASLTVPARIAPPPLDEGPHLSYAIQWFSFATIALVGTIVAVFRPPTALVPLAPRPDR